MSKQQHILVVMSNAVEGREDEYNDWYTNVHLPDVLDVPGFVAAQRFRLGPAQRGGAAPAQWQYAAIYDMETDNPAAPFEEMQRRRASGRMGVSDAIKDTWAYVYEPITGRVIAETGRTPRSDPSGVKPGSLKA